MNLSSLFPPTLVGRLLDDIGAIADAARSLPRLEREVTTRLDALAVELAPIQELPAMREAVEPLSAKLDALAEIVAPIQRLADVQREIEAMRSLLETMNLQLQSLEAVRAGIEPLDEDMRSVRESVDTLEPLIADVNARLGGLDRRIGELRADLAPLGELAEKIPGIG
jgi:chromosome segregation ATPase